MFTYELVDMGGETVAQGLGDCVKFAVDFNRGKKDQSQEFEYALYIMDSHGNERLSISGQNAIGFLMTVLDCVGRFGGKVP